MKVEYTIKPEEITTLFKLVKNMKKTIDKYIEDTGDLKYDVYFRISKGFNKKEELELLKQIFELTEIKNTKIKIES